MSMNKGMYTSNTCEWETPVDFFGKLDSEFGFDLDVCATPDITPKRMTGWKKNGPASAG